ncbi:MAG: sulfite exporter TauE/SafE family protein [Thermoplasmatota archaeon]
MILLLLIGLLAGVVSGLMGVGGGIVMTPALHYIGGYDWPTSVALSLGVIAVQAPVGIWKHHQRKAVDWKLGGLLALGGLIGVLMGHQLEPRLPVAALKLAFAGVMLYGAWKLVKPVRPRDGALDPVMTMGLGVVAGILSRLLGIGGGILTVPALALMGIAPAIAVASSLVPVATNAWFATVWNIGRDIPYLEAWPLLTAIIGAPIGVRLAHALPAKQLRNVVAVALCVVACLVAWSVVA